MKFILSRHFPCFAISFFFLRFAFPQTIGTFNSVSPGVQTQNLILPSTHTFQAIIKSGDVLDDGGALGGSLDFTGYVPISGSSANGYLSISSETTPAQVAIMNIAFNPGTKLWNKSNSGNVPFSIGSATSHLGNVSRFCSGTVTPDNTIMVCEETTAGGNVNSSVDSYEDLGWVIEIDPATKTVKDYNADGKADKLWAVGRQAHENVAIKSNRSVIYWGADNGGLSYIYKFMPATPGTYTSGLLYVLETTSAFGTGTWKLIDNTTVSDRNNTVGASTGAGAYSFDGIEDVEIGPDGKIYFAAKGPGRIYRFTDIGGTVSGLEVFVENTTYDVDPGAGVSNEAWGIGNDNLAFDGDGNLWVLQDGDRNHIWVVGPSHTAANPAVRLFAKTPAGCEPTGITFSPDYKFMFISFQHPDANTASQTDAAGVGVVFNTSTTVVVARKENLGCTISQTVRKTVASGNWNAATTWECGNLPLPADSVEILPGHAITLAASTQATHLKVKAGATLTLNNQAATLTIGAADSKTRSVSIEGSLSITNGTMMIFGNILFSGGYSFAMSGGNLKIDGNTGSAGSSIPNGQYLFSAPATAGSFSFTGGTLQIINPPLGAGSEALNAYYNFDPGGTLRFGDGVSVIVSNNANGFGGFGFPSQVGRLVLDAVTLSGNRMLKVVKPLTVKGSCEVRSGNLIQAAALTIDN